jgi:hypothetical protein
MLKKHQNYKHLEQIEKISEIIPKNNSIFKKKLIKTNINTKKKIRQIAKKKRFQKKRFQRKKHLTTKILFKS